MQVHTAVWVNQLNEWELKDLKGSINNLILGKYEFTNICDRSEMVQLNNEYKNNQLLYIEELPNDSGYDYTHIVKDTDGDLFAVIIKEGDWTESYFRKDNLKD